MAVLFLLALEFKVGVVNLRECFHKDKYDRIAEVDAELQKAFREYTETLAAAQKRVDTLKVKVQGLTKDMQIYWQTLGDLKQAETDFDFKKQTGRMQYLMKYNELQIQVYNEIRRVVNLYGKEHGFDLILRVEEPTLEDDDSVQGVSARIQSRVVFYHADGIDITNEVIKVLNAEYLKNKAATQGWECKTCKIKNVGPECSKCKAKKP